MIALLRYALLKSRRDHSLTGFLMVPIIVPVAALAGVTLGKGWHYPFFMDQRLSPVQNATFAANISMAAAILFASIAAFWTFRPEILSKSIGSFVFAARPLTIAMSLILFGAAIGFFGWIGSLVLIRVFTAALPAHAGVMVLKVAILTLGASAAGALTVTVSAQPATIVASYLASLVLIGLLQNTRISTQLAVAAGILVISTCLSAVLLERRCAA